LKLRKIVEEKENLCSTWVPSTVKEAIWYIKCLIAYLVSGYQLGSPGARRELYQTVYSVVYICL
jgi:hypothetical protein